jgi:Na+-transporting methylmalonyl-CoA/oxaloacetate decarboxylase beta subunit
VRPHYFEITTLLLNLAALILCLEKADVIIIGLGVLALLFSIGFNTLLNKARNTNTKIKSLPLIAALAVSCLPLAAALYFRYISPSEQGTQTVFIISSYIIGISLIAVLSFKKQTR